MKKALITGISGQDGSYLAELLLSKDYEVHGIIRRSSSINTDRIDSLIENDKIFNKTLFLHYGDVTDANNLNELVTKIKPDEFYNLAAQSHVKVSFEIPSYTAQVDGVGTLNVLEAVRNHSPETKVYQASTSEMFGGVGYNMPKTGYTEKSPIHPRSPYGCAKVYAYWITKNYREAYGLHASNGWLFNHESPRRGPTFVTKKITTWFGKNIECILENKPFRWNLSPLQMGNLHSFRDWGHAKDYVEAQYLILQQDKPDDYVIATGETHTVKEFIDYCFACMSNGKTLEWYGSGIDEKAYYNGRIVVEVNSQYFRPSEVDYLLGDATKARSVLGWEPKYDFKRLVEDMSEYDKGFYSV
jgi:GDPmannose 4,6-dehydratase